MENIPLASQWVKERLKAYSAPTRKGIPRDKPRGFPQHKYSAACLHVFYGGIIKTTNTLGKLSGASPALVRNWRREGRFAAVVAEEQHNFAVHFVKGLLGSSAERRFSLLAELSAYSPDARKEILLELQKQVSASCPEERPSQRIVEGILLHLTLRMAEWEPGNSDAFREAVVAGREILNRHHGQIQKRVTDPEAAYHLEILKAMADRWLEIARKFKESAKRE